MAPGWQGYLLEQWAGHLTSSSELWPQKLHPGPCQGPKDATHAHVCHRPLDILRTQHTQYTLHECANEGPALVPARTQRGRHRLGSSLPVGKPGAPEESLCFGVSPDRHPSASSPFLSESLPVRACSPKNRAHKGAEKHVQMETQQKPPALGYPLLTPGWPPRELLGLPTPA